MEEPREVHASACQWPVYDGDAAVLPLGATGVWCKTQKASEDAERVLEVAGDVGSCCCTPQPQLLPYLAAFLPDQPPPGCVFQQRKLTRIKSG